VSLTIEKASLSVKKGIKLRINQD